LLIRQKPSKRCLGRYLQQQIAEIIHNKNCPLFRQFAEDIESHSIKKIINMLFHSLST